MTDQAAPTCTTGMEIPKNEIVGADEERGNQQDKNFRATWRARMRRKEEDSRASKARNTGLPREVTIGNRAVRMSRILLLATSTRDPPRESIAEARLSPAFLVRGVPPTPGVLGKESELLEIKEIWFFRRCKKLQRVVRM